MINHRGDVGPKFRKKLGDFVKLPFQRIKAGPQGNAVWRGMTAPGLLRMTPEHCVKVPRLPSKSHGQGFERPPAATALDSVALDFPHNGRGHARTLRKLALTPAKLTEAVTDNPSDRSPVPWIAFRHAFLRVPLPAPRLADPWAIRSKLRPAATVRRHSVISRAEISYKSLISAPMSARLVFTKEDIGKRQTPLAFCRRFCIGSNDCT